MVVLRMKGYPPIIMYELVVPKDACEVVDKTITRIEHTVSA